MITPPDPAQAPQRPSSALTSLQRVCLFCVLSLIALCVGWELWWAPLKGGTGALAWKSLPLVFTLNGLLKHRLYTYRWTSLLVWLYVTEALVRVSSDQDTTSRALAGLEGVLSLGLFVACAIYIRRRLKHSTADEATVSHAG